jgi:mono/diheme cytochrome c family protein
VRRGLLVILLMVALIGTAGWLFATRFTLSALDDPGPMETYLATKVKLWTVSRSARGPLSQAPPDNDSSVSIGQMIYGGECASCHGTDGRMPTGVGRWMYPRAVDLGSREVQQWSDAELFWIIKHGIRLSGMPGFGRTRSDEQIWHLVHYVRSLGARRQGMERRP